MVKTNSARIARIKQISRELGLSTLLVTLIQIFSKIVSYFPSKHIRVAGLRLIGCKVGPNVLMYYGIKTLFPWRMAIGRNNNFGFHVILDARGGVTIGDNCNIGHEVAIWTASHDVNSSDYAYVSAPVTIGDRAWISFRAVILPGVNIGEGAVVAAGAVVTKDVPPFSIAAGVPAKVIGARERDLTYSLGRSNGIGFLFL